MAEKSETRKPTGVSWTQVGNVVNVFNMVNVTVFGIAAVQGWSILDPTWRKEGFCISNADTPYWTSHDLCLYADLVQCTLMGLAYALLREEPGMSEQNEIIDFSIFGHVSHGFAHGVATRDGVSFEPEKTLLDSYKEMAMKTSWQELAIERIQGVIFWVALIRASARKARWHHIFLLALLASQVQLFFVQNQFGFTYVQTVLFLLAGANEIMRPPDKKGFEYALYSLIVGFPLAFVGWIESTQCTNGVRDYLGGHLIYDSYIGFSILAFYLLCWLRQRNLSRMRKEI